MLARLLGASPAVVAVAVIGVGAANARPQSATVPALHAEAAVVVESGGRPAVALLSPAAKRWRVVSRIRVNRGIRALAWMPRGRKLAVTTNGGNLSNELQVIDALHGTHRTVATARRGEPPAFFGSLAWSPDGRWIAVTRSPELYDADIDLLDAKTGSVARSFHASARYDSALAWSADGRSLYFARQPTGHVQPSLQRLVVRTGKARPINGLRGLDPSVRSDGALAFAAADGIRVFRSGRERNVAGSKKGDRLPIWLRGRSLVLAERPAAGCPRYGGPMVCSHVVLMGIGAAPRYLIDAPARNPATR